MHSTHRQCTPIGHTTQSAVVLRRYELDMSDWKHAISGRHLMVVDELVLAPSIPIHLRGAFHAGLCQLLIQLGEVHGMTVAFLEDLDI